MKVGLQLQVTVIVTIMLAIKILDRVMYDVKMDIAIHPHKWL